MKNEIKKDVAPGISTTVGATTGVVIGTAISPVESQAEEMSIHDTSSHNTVQFEHYPHIQMSSVTQPPMEPQNTNPQNLEETPNTRNESDEIQVIAYDRITNEDDSKMDIAVVSINGNELEYIDFNLDGEADAIICDANQNGMIEDSEIQIVTGGGITMQPLAEAVGFNPLYAQNDLPDYVNNAHIDTYIA